MVKKKKKIFNRWQSNQILPKKKKKRKRLMDNLDLDLAMMVLCCEAILN